MLRFINLVALILRLKTTHIIGTPVAVPVEGVAAVAVLASRIEAAVEVNRELNVLRKCISLH